MFQTFIQLRSEDEPERIISLIERGYTSAAWVLKKVRQGLRRLETHSPSSFDLAFPNRFFALANSRLHSRYIVQRQNLAMNKNDRYDSQYEKSIMHIPPRRYLSPFYRSQVIYE